MTPTGPTITIITEAIVVIFAVIVIICMTTRTGPCISRELPRYGFLVVGVTIITT